MENMVLKGTRNEQAKQLLELLKEKQISVEELDKLVPMGTDFIKEFCNVLKEQISNEKESYNVSVTVFETVMSKLGDSLVNNKELTTEDRRLILETISQLGDQLRDMQKNKQNKDTGFKLFLTGCVALVGLVIVVLTGKKPKTNSN